MSDRINRKMMVQIAKLYYLGEVPQTEIANLLGISRSKVSRLLALSKRMKLIDISITNVPHMNEELAECIRSHFQLKKVIIVPSSISLATTMRNASEAACQYFDTIARDGMRIGLSDGESILDFVREYHPRHAMPNSIFFQLVGGICKQPPAFNNKFLVETAAQKLSASHRLLTAPMIAANCDVQDILLKENAEIFAAFPHLDIAICDISAPLLDLYPSQLSTYLSAPEIRSALRSSVAIFCGQLLGENGSVQHSSFSNRIISISSEDIKNTPTVIGIAVGKEKAAAITATLRSRHLNVLVTDEIAAISICSTIRGSVANFLDSSSS